MSLFTVYLLRPQQVEIYSGSKSSSISLPKSWQASSKNIVLFFLAMK